MELKSTQNTGKPAAARVSELIKRLITVTKKKYAPSSSSSSSSSSPATTSSSSHFSDDQDDQATDDKQFKYVLRLLGARMAPTIAEGDHLQVFEAIKRAGEAFLPVITIVLFVCVWKQPN
jgi:hypothetical protein